MLADKGRLAIVTFHSLEDRMVKRYLAERSTSAARPSRHAPEDRRAGTPLYRLLTTRPRNPGAAEIDRNPRARSAHLRAAERIRRPS